MQKKEGVFLGVSLMTTDYYSKARIIEYARWCLSNYDRFLVVIADLPEELNWVQIKGISEEDAKTRVGKRTENLKKGYARALSGFENAAVVSVNELLRMERYNMIFLSLLNEYKHNSEFNNRVNSTVRTNLSGLLTSINAPKSIIGSLAPYVLHEYAISILLKWDYSPSYSAQVSPKLDVLLTDVLCGKFGSIFEQLKILPSPYEYITNPLSEE